MAADEAQTNPDEICRLANDAVADLIVKIDPGAMATGFALLVKVVDSEGEPALWMAAAPEQKAWDTVGLLKYGLMIEQAAVVQDRLQGDV